MDVGICARKEGFAEDYERLNEICDAILCGKTDDVIRHDMAPGDENFNVAGMDQKVRSEILNRLLKM